MCLSRGLAFVDALVLHKSVVSVSRVLLSSRPDQRTPGQADRLDIVETTAMDFALKAEEREAYTSKTIFAHKVSHDQTKAVILNTH